MSGKLFALAQSPPPHPEGPLEEALDPSLHYHFQQMAMGAFPEGWVGRGIVPLLGHYPTEGLLLAQLEQLHPNPLSPRSFYHEDRIEELASSIEADGLLEPLVVRANRSGEGYLILDGHYRYLALKRIAERHGAATLRVPVMPLGGTLAHNPMRQMRAMVSLNTRVPLTPLERALAVVYTVGLGGIDLERLQRLVFRVNQARGKGLAEELASLAVFLRALGLYGIGTRTLGYYLRVFLQAPELYELAQQKRLSDRLFRVLARPVVRSHPLYPGYIREVRMGIASEEDLIRRIREEVFFKSKDPSQEAFSLLHRALSRALGKVKDPNQIAEMVQLLLEESKEKKKESTG